MRQRFAPAAGKLAVIFEAVSEVVKEIETVDGKKTALYQTEEAAAYRKQVNPWALVVGVGGPRVSDTGRLIETDVKAGEKVAISQVGRNLPLVAADGQIEYVYVLPFEGVLGTLERECEKCGTVSRESVDDLECPACPKIAAPTNQEVKLVGMTR